MKKKREKDDKRNQNMFSLEEQRGALHSTLIMAEKDEQGDEMADKDSESPKVEKLEGTSSSVSPRTRKRPGRVSMKKSDVEKDNGNTDYDDML